MKQIDKNMGYRRIDILEYDPNWPLLFNKEKKFLQSVFLENSMNIHHIGSTSILNMAAKPIIDILIVVKNIMDVDKKNSQMIHFGYICHGEYGMEGRRFFTKGILEERMFNVHVWQEGRMDILRHLAFRDYMKNHPYIAMEYSDLKKQLATMCDNDIYKYMDGKNTFIKKHESLALIENKMTLENIKNSLLYFHVSELKNLCVKLKLQESGKKIILIKNILYFLETGKIQYKPKIPDVSKAKSGQKIALEKNQLILKGSYKNDLKTRNFFKEMIGNHFHFTAFGIDWIENLWLEGKPPTYLEFANMWKFEYEKRQKSGSSPKEEWMLIRFCQNYVKNHPSSSKQQMMESWKLERKKNLKIVSNYFSI